MQLHHQRNNLKNSRQHAAKLRTIVPLNEALAQCTSNFNLQHDAASTTASSLREGQASTTTTLHSIPTSYLTTQLLSFGYDEHVIEDVHSLALLIHRYNHTIVPTLLPEDVAEDKQESFAKWIANSLKLPEFSAAESAADSFEEDLTVEEINTLLFGNKLQPADSLRRRRQNHSPSAHENHPKYEQQQPTEAERLAVAISLLCKNSTSTTTTASTTSAFKPSSTCYASQQQLKTWHSMLITAWQPGGADDGGNLLSSMHQAGVYRNDKSTLSASSSSSSIAHHDVIEKLVVLLGFVMKRLTRGIETRLTGSPVSSSSSSSSVTNATTTTTTTTTTTLFSTPFNHLMPFDNTCADHAPTNSENGHDEYIDLIHYTFALSAFLHHHFLTIQPFEKGNGTLARVLAKRVLDCVMPVDVPVLEGGGGDDDDDAALFYLHALGRGIDEKSKSATKTRTHQHYQQSHIDTGTCYNNKRGRIDSRRSYISFAESAHSQPYLSMHPLSQLSLNGGEGGEVGGCDPEGGSSAGIYQGDITRRDSYRFTDFTTTTTIDSVDDQTRGDSLEDSHPSPPTTTSSSSPLFAPLALMKLYLCSAIQHMTDLIAKHEVRESEGGGSSSHDVAVVAVASVAEFREKVLSPYIISKSRRGGALVNDDDTSIHDKARLFIRVFQGMEENTEMTFDLTMLMEEDHLVNNNKNGSRTRRRNKSIVRVVKYPNLYGMFEEEEDDSEPDDSDNEVEGDETEEDHRVHAFTRHPPVGREWLNDVEQQQHIASVPQLPISATAVTTNHPTTTIDQLILKRLEADECDPFSFEDETEEHVYIPPRRLC